MTDYSAMKRKSKEIARDELTEIIAAAVRQEAMLAVGGTTIHQNPLGLLRALIKAIYSDREKKKSPAIVGLVVVAGPLAGPAVDLLCGAGLVRQVRAAYVAAEYLGLCPSFMRTVTSGAVRVWECGEAILLQGLLAQAEGRPFGCTLEGLGSDLPELNPDLKIFDNPVTGKPVVAVPPIAPDVCFLHVPRADTYGNCAHVGPVYSDMVMAAATQKNGGVVIVSTEEIVPPASRGCLGKEESPVTLPAALVDYVVALPGGAWPTACHGVYAYDEEALRVALAAGKTAESFQDWLRKEVLDAPLEIFVPDGPSERSSSSEAATVGGNTPAQEAETASGYSGAELLVVRLSECIADGDFGSAGANSPIPQAAIRLAQLTHAPNLTYISSYSGYISRLRPVSGNEEQPGDAHLLPRLREKMFWSSFDFRNRPAAECALASPEIFWLRRDFFFVGGLQFDRCGNINLIGIQKDGQMKIRGPGSAGVALVAATASRLYLYAPGHDRRTIVDRVAFVSGPGHPEKRQKRKKLGLPGAGPTLLMTPLCTFDFNDEGLIRLKSLNPGVTVEEVLDRTGTTVDVPAADVPVAAAPTPEQLIIIRRLIDPDGILQTLKTA